MQNMASPLHINSERQIKQFKVFRVVSGHQYERKSNDAILRSDKQKLYNSRLFVSGDTLSSFLCPCMLWWVRPMVRC